MGSSISPRLHIFSQGWLQTRPQIPARGIGQADQAQGLFVSSRRDQGRVPDGIAVHRAGVLAGGKDQGLADPCRALFVPDVGLVLVPEMVDGRKHGVGAGLPQAAEGGIFDDLSHLQQEFNIPFPALPLW